MEINNINCNDSLKVEIFVVGYKNQGESILCLIKVDNVCVFSILIDSYKKGNLFVMDNIIKENNIDHLDLICWSHPHDDHSIGLEELIDNYKNDETEICIPLRSDIDMNDCSIKTKELFNSLLEKAKRNEEKIQIVSDSKNLLYYHNIGDIVHYNEKYKINIHSLAPRSNQIIKNTFLDHVNKNEESIVFNLSIGGYNFIFTGDADNREIGLIPKNAIPKYINFLKIPHHCSETSNDILGLICDENSVACTTSFKPANLPNICLLEKYNSKFDIVENTDEISDKYEYGIAHTVFDILNGERYVDFSGSAQIHS